LNEEYVVNPPSTPAVKASRTVGDMVCVCSAIHMIQLMTKEPTRLTVKVPHGKSGPKARTIPAWTR
jgi:hypothetical protein